MQINAIALYKKGHEPQVVRLRLGELNIITGWQQTGKTSLGDIVEYCLGRDEATFARGALDVVDWFGILVEHDGARAFAARPAPRQGAASTTAAMLVIGAADVLATDQLVSTTDIGGLRIELSRFMGMADDEAPTATPAGEPVRATIAQALFYCFQREDEIGSAQHLFHRMHEDRITETIRDTLPFFLGAVGPEQLALRQQLAETQREARRLERETEALERSRAEVEVRSSSLLSEATAIGLLPKNTTAALEAEALELLREAVATPEAVPDSPSNAAAELSRLRQQQRELNEQLLRVQEQRALLRERRQERNAYGSEVREQAVRLRSLELLPSAQTANGACPICRQELPHPDPTASALSLAAEELDRRLERVNSLEPHRRKLLNDLRAQTQRVREELRRVNAGIVALAQSETELARFAEATEQRAFVRGRITQFLDTVRALDETKLAASRRRLKRLHDEIAALVNRLDGDAADAEVDTRLTFVNDNITKWAQQLGLEHSELHIRLDPKKLTLVADDRRGAIALRRIGSQAIRTGYHVVAHLALHTWFVEEERPVPHFLFVDQPTGAWYPEDIPEDAVEKYEFVPESDRAKVAALFNLIRERVNALNGGLQVIITDHANPADIEWFSGALVENWRDGRKLVPVKWLDAPVDEDTGNADDEDTGDADDEGADEEETAA
jgi:hypothetical protein